MTKQVPAPGFPTFAAVLVIALGSLGAMPGVVEAQTASVDVNKAFKVAGAHDGATTTHYVLTVDRPGTLANLVTTLPVSALVAGEVTFDVAAQTTVGAYTAQVCARNVDPADATNFAERCSAALPFNVAKPVMPQPGTAPTIRIVGTVAIAGGRKRPAVFEFDVASLAVVPVEALRTLRIGAIQ